MLYLAEELMNSSVYLKTVEKIEKLHFITDGKWDWEHGIGHFKRVSNYVVKILNQFDVDDRTLDLGVIAALLHDIGLVIGEKKGHAIRSSIMFQQYLKDTDLTQEEFAILKQAIADHSNGECIESLIGLALVLADKLDVTYHRTICSTVRDQVNLEIQKIRQVDVDISDKVLAVSYIVAEDFDIGILVSAWDKMITIPQKVADYLNRDFLFFN